MNLQKRSTKLLKLEHYRFADPHPREVNLYKNNDLIPPNLPQYILRMLVETPDRGLNLPMELNWLHPAVCMLRARLAQWTFANLPYVYITVRSGRVQTKTDDMWHVDGFSARYPHVPEQDFIWSDCYPTEYYNRSIPIPVDFDPFRHDLHKYFQAVCTNEEDVKALPEREWMHIDPYIIHRRPKEAAGEYRTFVRVSFLPIIIEDDRNTPNPLIPVRPFNRPDIRKTLVAY